MRNPNLPESIKLGQKLMLQEIKEEYKTRMDEID